MKTVKSIDSKWTFYIYNNNKDLKSKIPTVFFLARPFPKGHNSKFPFVILSGYRTNNPHWTFNSGLPFNIGEGDVILLLKHNYQAFNKQLDLGVKLLKTYYNVPYYDCNTGKII